MMVDELVVQAVALQPVVVSDEQGTLSHSALSTGSSGRKGDDTTPPLLLQKRLLPEQSCICKIDQKSCRGNEGINQTLHTRSENEREM